MIARGLTLELASIPPVYYRPFANLSRTSVGGGVSGSMGGQSSCCSISFEMSSLPPPQKRRKREGNGRRAEVVEEKARQRQQQKQLLDQRPLHERVITIQEFSVEQQQAHKEAKAYFRRMPNHWFLAKSLIDKTCKINGKRITMRMLHWFMKNYPNAGEVLLPERDGLLSMSLKEQVRLFKESKYHKAIFAEAKRGARYEFRGVFTTPGQIFWLYKVFETGIVHAYVEHYEDVQRAHTLAKEQEAYRKALFPSPPPPPPPPPPPDHAHP